MRWALEALANGLWQGILLTIFLALALRFGPRLRAQSRYALWFVALFAVVALPALSTQRTLGVYALGAYDSAKTLAIETYESLTTEKTQPEDFVTLASTNATGNSNNSAIARSASSSSNRSENQRSESETAAPVNAETVSGISNANATERSESLPASPQFAATQTEGPLSIAATGSTEPADTAALNFALPNWLVFSLLGFWLVVSSALLLRLAFSFEHLRKLRRDAQFVDDQALLRFGSLSSALSLKRPVQFLLSERVKTPLAIGLGAPAVIFPTQLYHQLSDSEKDQVVLHELNHLKRFDDWGALAQCLMQALFFFNPAALWISNRLDLERELACDESVVDSLEARGADGARDYAGCLTRLAELSAVQSVAPRSALAAGAFFSGKRLTLRVERILQNNLRFSARASRAVVASLGLLMMGALVQFTLAPKVVAFDERDEARRASQAKLSSLRGPSDLSELAEWSHIPGVTGFSGLSSLSASGLGVIDVSTAAPKPTGSGYSYSYVTGVTGSGAVTPVAAVESEYDYASPERMRELRARLKEMKLEQARKQRDLARRQHELQREMFRESRSASRTHVETVAPNLYRYYTEEGGRKNSVFFAPLADGDEGYVGSDEPLLGIFDDNGDRVHYLTQRVPSSLFAPSPLSSSSPPSPPGVPSLPNISVIATPSVAGIGNFDGIVDFGDGDIHYSWNKGSKHFKVRASGEITFNEEGTDVESISDEGYITIRERTRSYDREYEVYSYEDGSLDRTYFDDGRRAEIDDEAREWIEESILDVIRNTGIGAEARVEKLMKEGGVASVLTEIEEIESDHTRRKYYTILLEQDGLTTNDVAEVIRAVGRGMDSDYERAQLLAELDEGYLKDEAVMQAYIEAISDIDSDYEKRRALSNVFERRELAAKTLVELLAVAEEFDSDYERAQLLGAIADRGLADPAVREAYIRAIEGISSGYEKRQALSKVAERETLDEASLLAALALAESISSDYERSQLLVELFPEGEISPAVLRAYIRAVEDISSNYEKRRTLNMLTDRKDLSADIVLAVLQISETITSDYERGELLKDMADFCRDDNKLWAAYVDAVEDIDSDYEKGKVLSRMDLDEPVDESLMLSALLIIESMDSDYEKGKLLRKFADICLENDNLREPFLDAVDTIDSDYERNSLLDKIYKRDRRERRKER